MCCLESERNRVEEKESLLELLFVYVTAAHERRKPQGLHLCLAERVVVTTECRLRALRDDSSLGLSFIPSRHPWPALGASQVFFTVSESISFRYP